MVVKLQPVDQRWQRFARRNGQGIAIAVIVCQAVVDDRLRNGLTATAAHAARLPGDAHRKVQAGRHRLPAMV